MQLSLQEVERAIKEFPPEEQRRFLAELPHLLKFSLEDLSLLRTSEDSFSFWNNPEDSIYDNL